MRDSKWTHEPPDEPGWYAVVGLNSDICNAGHLNGEPRFSARSRHLVRIIDKGGLMLIMPFNFTGETLELDGVPADEVWWWKDQMEVPCVEEDVIEAQVALDIKRKREYLEYCEAKRLGMEEMDKEMRRETYEALKEEFEGE